MKSYVLLLLVLLAPALVVAEEPPAAPPLTLKTYPALKKAIAPAPEECVWREIGWRPTFGDAVAEALREEKPIFLWAMNGHPLACV